jgi:phosphoadenosine phosphosulfate reductase
MQETPTRDWPQDPDFLARANVSLEASEPIEVLRWAAETFGLGMTIGTAFGASGVVLLDMVREVCPRAEVFYIDTGLFFPETYALIRRLEDRYGMAFRKVVPELTVGRQAREHGERLWERDPDKCCGMRKVAPMASVLSGKSAWVTALRRDQSHSRRATPVLGWNEKHQLLKVAPLARMTRAQVWQWIHDRGLPYNPLHDRGFPSIGCKTCTRAVRPDEDLRSGRWSGRAKTECGLHV